jgi:preprotein translocase subunit SecA
MRPVYDLLGGTVGWVSSASTTAGRRRAYAAQVTYGPVSELGFDVLRDRFATNLTDPVMGAPDVALIDEADSVLVDEALVPLVLAGAVDSDEAGPDMAEVVRRLRPGQQHRNAECREKIAERLRLRLGLAAKPDRVAGGHRDLLRKRLDQRVNLALHAEALLRRDVDYLVQDGKIKLINPARGRVARLQRWPDGLQAAVEAKEGPSSSRSGEILDSITVQALVRRYATVSGMTGTAMAVGEQLREFYGLDRRIRRTALRAHRCAGPAVCHCEAEGRCSCPACCGGARYWPPRADRNPGCIRVRADRRPAQARRA